jgi:hypothetical protein
LNPKPHASFVRIGALIVSFPGRLMTDTPTTGRSSLAVRLIRWAAPPLIVCGVMGGIASGTVPKGVPGEWTWNAPATGLTAAELLAATATLVLVLAFSFIGERLLSSRFGRGLTVFALFPVAAAVGVGWHLAAPAGYGLAKWPIASYNSGSSGYFTVANEQIDDLGAFMRAYPEWIKTQDVLHIGTHPPGLFVEAELIQAFWRARPEAARAFLRSVPQELSAASRALTGGAAPAPDVQATAISLGIVRWLACALTVWPIYGACRRLGQSGPNSFRVALLWSAVPSAVLFQPASDVAFALLSASAIWLAISPNDGPAWRRRWFEPVVVGGILALGMFLSLVFLAVGLIVAVVVATNPGESLSDKLTRLGLIGLGFLAGTAAWAFCWHTNPASIWLTNQAKHAGFYAQYPRTYLAWLAADAAETAVGLGLPAFVLVLAAFASALKKRETLSAARVGLSTAVVLVVLAVSGRSLSEVGRLWIPFYPMLLTAIACRVSADSPWFFRWVLFWSGVQLVWLQSLVQCVYPI